MSLIDEKNDGAFESSTGCQERDSSGSGWRLGVLLGRWRRDVVAFSYRGVLVRHEYILYFKLHRSRELVMWIVLSN